MDFRINHFCLKFNKANAMLCKIRHYVNETTLRSIYYAIFQSHLSYVCTAWGQNIKYNHRISILQRKAIIIIFFSYFNELTFPLFSKAKILKFIDFIQMETRFFAPFIISIVFISPNYHHNYKTRFASSGLLKIPTNNTSIYGAKSFEISTVTSWNFFQSYFADVNLKETSVNQIKHLIKIYFFTLYDNSVI